MKNRSVRRNENSSAHNRTRLDAGRCAAIVAAALTCPRQRRNSDLIRPIPRHYLIASDFDQTLSFNDSGAVLADLLGVQRFEQRVEGLARINLVQQGGELAYLIRHDPEFRGVRHEHLVEAGRRVRLKGAVSELIQFLQSTIENSQFSFFVISAAPRQIVTSALADVLPAERIFGTELEFDECSGEVRAIRRVPAGYGKVAVIEELQHRLQSRRIG
jgi:phosphoserine phosphatase